MPNKVKLSIEAAGSFACFYPGVYSAERNEIFVPGGFMTFEDLQAALDEFELPPSTTWKKIKTRHRELVRRYHPDKSEQADTDKIKRINAAYKILSAYVGDYRFDFSREQFLDQYPEERLREQFWSEKPWGENL